MGTQRVEAVSGLLASGLTRLAVKRGSAGATLWGPSGRCDVAARPVTAVDVVGAGDAFCAGLLSGLLDGLPDRAALSRANALDAVAVSTHGDWEGLPRRHELDTLAGAVPGATHR